VNRTQLVLLGFTACSWIALVVILIAAPDVYDAELKPLGLAGHVEARLAFLVGVTGLLILLAVGVVYRWHWLFWLVLIAFAAGILRLPLFGLQLLGVAPLDVPLWYSGLQAVIGVIQIGIAAAMYGGYRKHGVWGEF
jgi:hypothetical protein